MAAEDYSDQNSDRRLCSDRPDPIAESTAVPLCKIAVYDVVTVAQLSQLREVRIHITVYLP